MISSKTPSPSAWRATGESGSRSRRRNVAFGPFNGFPPGLLPGEQHSGWVSAQHPPRTQPQCQESELTKVIFIHQMRTTSAPLALTERVNAAARACHPVSIISASLKATWARSTPGLEAGLRSTPPQLRSPRFAHSMKQSSAVVSSERLFGLMSSSVTSLPLNTAFAPRRTLELAWSWKVLIHVGSGARFTRKRTEAGLSERFSFSSKVGSLTRMIGMDTPSLCDDRARALRPVG